MPKHGKAHTHTEPELHTNGELIHHWTLTWQQGSGVVCTPPRSVPPFVESFGFSASNEAASVPGWKGLTTTCSGCGWDHVHVKCLYMCMHVCNCLSWPVADPTISLEGDSDMASASLSRRPSSLASAEPTLCMPKLSGQLPHTSSKVTPRPSKGPAWETQTQV